MRFYTHYAVKDCLHALLVSYPFCWVNISTSTASSIFPMGALPSQLDGWGYMSLIEYLEEKAPDLLLMPARMFPSSLKTAKSDSGPKEVARIYVESHGERGFLFVMSDK